MFRCGMLKLIESKCEPGVSCNSCDFKTELDLCNSKVLLPYYFCHEGQPLTPPTVCYVATATSEGSVAPRALILIPSISQEEKEEPLQVHHSLEMCARSIPIANGECSVHLVTVSACRTLSSSSSTSYALSLEVNPGESGCVDGRQCDAVWPDAVCSASGTCECPQSAVASRTRDGTVCISDQVPPSCPLPEPHNGVPNPATVLANPDTHPLNPGSYMPVFCTSTSTETYNSHGGDGSTWCVYPDGDQDVYVTDIYDCIAHPQVTNNLFPEYHASIDGICCPNRATGTCVQFTWDPDTIDGASPNNFRTLQHCESFCRDTYLCSPYGGRKYISKPLVNYDRGILIAGSKATTRYYYDVDRGRCMNFVHFGLGNFNNFVTKQDCEEFCSRLLCANGSPLRIGEEWQRCDSTSECPSSHFCSSSHRVCCPTAQLICTQTKLHGDCNSTVRRYWYNAAIRQCETFHYTGCHGNDNNFPSLVACQTQCRGIATEPKCPQGRAYRDHLGKFAQCSAKVKCPSNYMCSFDGNTHGCCPTRAFTCSLGADKGVKCGSGRSFRYFFNAAKQSCDSFQYEGCDGNSNNFLNAQHCEQYCGVGGCPNGGFPLREEKTNRPVICSGLKGCPSSHECISVPTKGNVAFRCCPSKAPQPGSQCSKITTSRFYFNLVTKQCSSFHFNGCSGNLNNFATKELCDNFCMSAGCELGEMVYKKSNTSLPFRCDGDLRNSCPNNYECRFNNLLGYSICCGSHLTGQLRLLIVCVFNSSMEMQIYC
ncbi:unnamed protein product [Nippostrongylus brasiliensis]|uniref:Kunitz/Bovine pancreatic trypsin inhibitor domain protein n=1 Tax=Nippostrongylus brasiliensis TaxID=27835 RepID=A0A0N4Y692_NIPBR|nr:unnamed protein product [Nippostrongylus brasiliensis]